MLSDDLQKALDAAFVHARKNGHELLTVEHLLLSLLDDGQVAEVLRAVGAIIDKLQSDLHQFLHTNVPMAEQGAQGDYEVQPTVGFQRVLQRAVYHVQAASKKEVQPINVIVALFAERDSHAVYLLAEQGISRLDVVNYVSHGIAKTETDKPEREDEGAKEETESTESTPSHLEQYTQNLNRRARDGLIDPLIGRDAELQRVVQTLCRRRKNNPLLVGEAGVGKTAIAEGLAFRIVNGDVPDVLDEAVVYALDLGGLVAGTKYRGDFEKRLKGVLKELDNQPWAILFIDEIHTIIGAGSASGGVMDASNLLKPALSDGQLRCMGSTTYTEYRGIFEKDHALARRFQKIDVVEPSIADTVQILKGLKLRYEEHHKVKYSQASLESAAELSARHINDRHLPDKAIDVIDEVGAALRLKTTNKSRRRVVKARDIEEIVARIARIPAKSVSSDDKVALRTLERDLKLQIFGQDEAISTLGDAIKLSRSGLGSPERPIANFLFAGPTGVGKTEVTRQLASLLGIELIRFDMSEYMERHAVSRLIGAPPGYVGFDQGGLLTEAINKHPHAVVLLDEIEKAHPEIFNLLLQIMDHGTLTDNNGRKADFRNVILVMTTNAGATEMDRASIGFSKQDHSSDGMAVIKKMFTPEFRNRLDAIVPFAPLSHEVVRSVVDKLLMQLEVTLEPRKVRLDVDGKARDWLAEHGYDKAMGARPMARLIQERIKRPLADELLFGQLVNGGEVQVRIRKGELHIKVKAPEAAPA